MPHTVLSELYVLTHPILIITLQGKYFTNPRMVLIILFISSHLDAAIDFEQAFPVGEWFEPKNN